MVVAGIPRDILIFAAFFGMGLFVYEVVRSRQAALQHTQQIEHEIGARGEAEEQLKVLVESSPGGGVYNRFGRMVLLANEAAHRLFVVPAGTLPGRSIHEFLPSLVNVQAPLLSNEKRRPIRTAMQCRGRRQNGEVFLADIWFSTYSTSAGSRLAAMVMDGSEDLRNREELSLNQLLAGSRILVGRFHTKSATFAGRSPWRTPIFPVTRRSRRTSENDKDFEALGSLILALEKIAAMDLRQMADQASSVDLASLLEEFRIVVEVLSCRSRISTFARNGFDALPAVWADRQSLLQVFLNLTQKQRTRDDERRAARTTDHGEFRETADYGAVQRYRLRRGASRIVCFVRFNSRPRRPGSGLYLSGRLCGCSGVICGMSRNRAIKFHSGVVCRGEQWEKWRQRKRCNNRSGFCSSTITACFARA